MLRMLSRRWVLAGVLAGVLVICSSLVARAGAGWAIAADRLPASTRHWLDRLASIAYRMQVISHSVPIAPDAGPTSVVVDANAVHQVWEGFGANVRDGI